MASTISPDRIAEQVRAPELMPPWLDVCLDPLRDPRLSSKSAGKAWSEPDRSCEQTEAIGLTSSSEPKAGNCGLSRVEPGSQVCACRGPVSARLCRP